MTIYFIPTEYKFFLNKKQPDAYNTWQLRLKSNFGNRQVELSGTDLQWEMTLITNNDRYSEWTITPNANQEAELDMQGFWQFTVLGATDAEPLVEVEKGLVKVVNESPRKLDEQPEYEGPNPNAESYIIYNQ